MENTRCRTVGAARWLAVLGYAALLFYLSSLHHPSVPHFPFSDKVMHLGFYAGFGLVLAWACNPMARGWPRWKIVLAGGLGAALYGATDEFHQLFVEGRTADLADLAFDVLGGLLGGALYLLIIHYVARFRSKGKIEGDRPAILSL